MSKIIGVMMHDKCRDSLSCLIDMPFATFFHLEMSLYLWSLREEEINNNQMQIDKRR